jgi:uncharacterized protein (DUF2249 family)
MSQTFVDLDIRPILRDGGEPFGAIMSAVAALAPDQGLRLYATFKPVPLFQVLGARGFTPSAREIGGGDWEVIFTPVLPAADTARAAAPEPEPATAPAWQWPEPSVELDNRDLEPPEPMVRTLEALERLRPGETLAALMPREPMFLFEELLARGCKWRGDVGPDGSYRIVIRAGERKETPDERR